MKTFRHETSTLDGFTIGSHIQNILGQVGIVTGRHPCQNPKTCRDCKVDRQPYTIMYNGIMTGWCWSLWRDKPGL